MPYCSPEKHFQSINIFEHAMFVCLFVVGDFLPNREFFTHMEKSRLPVKGCEL